jgi:hypothetical protein
MGRTGPSYDRGVLPNSKGISHSVSYISETLFLKSDSGGVPVRRVTGRLWSLVLLVWLIVGGTAGAAVEEKYYQQYRDEAPVAFAGTVLSDRGGKALVRVDATQRGALTAGGEVTVIYPEYRNGKDLPIGATVYYDRFRKGDQLLVWGEGTDRITIVPKGIELTARGPESAPLTRLASWTIAAGAAALVTLAAGGMVWRKAKARPRRARMGR